jgi:hypothetical protein
MRTITSLIIALTLIGASAAIAQTTGTPNSGAGVQGMPGNKSGPPVNGQNSGDQSNGTARDQSSGTTQDTSKIPGLPGNKSGPPAQKPSRNQ